MLNLTLLQKLKLNIINIDFCEVNRDWHYNHVINPFSRLYLVTGGQGVVRHHKQTYTLMPSVMHLVPGFSPADYHCDDKLKQYYIHFSSDIEGQLEIFTEDVCHFQVEVGSRELDIMKRLLAINPKKALSNVDPEKYDRKTHLLRAQHPDSNYSPSEFMETKGILLQLLAKFIRNGPETSSPKRDKAFQRLQTVIHFIEDNLDKQITLAQLSDICFLHPDYFSRLFNKIMGVRPIEFLNRKRILKVQMLLMTTDMTLSEIARHTGFLDTTYLSRIFKKYTKQTISQYRDSQDYFH